MFNKKSNVEALRSYAPFRSLSEDDLRAIDRLAYITQVEAGQPLIREGGLGRQFIVLLEGTAVVRRGEEEVARLEAGDSFGEMSLLEDKPTNASVEATSPAMIAAFGIPEFDEMIRLAPGLARKLMVQLSERLRAASD